MFAFAKPAVNASAHPVRHRVLATASATALLTVLAQGAQAQTQPQADTGIETVVVSASRLTAAGFSAPTPTTVVGAKDLEQKAEVNVETTLTQLPSMTGTITQAPNGGASTGTAGLSNLNLRSLGTNRMLVLLDSERVVGAALTGVIDIAQLPQGLIQRVDIVTGGASASWGSDAVTGVANFILDKNFNGLKGNIQGGITTYGDDPTSLMQMTGGTGFDGGKGHFEISAEFSTDAGVHGTGGRSWYNASKIITQSIAATPAGTPQYIRSANVYDDTVAAGGIITAGPLRGIAFGPGGAPYQFQYGSFVVDPFMIGGDSSNDLGKDFDIATALNRSNVYSRLSYNLTPDISVFATAMYGATHSYEDPLQDLYKTASLTLQCSNPFLDPSVAAACATNKITSFQYGTYNKDLGPVHAINERIMRRFTLGGDGDFSLFGTDWTWDAYAEHGINQVNARLTGETLTPLYNLAIQAVRAPNGQIVCASAAAQAAGCVPLNVFGTGVMSQQAINWVEGMGIQPFKLTNQRQEAASYSMNGEPFEDWAGKVSVATGIEYREEAYGLHSTDPYSVGGGYNGLLSSTGSNWFQGNFQQGQGNYHVAEAFVEAGVPLIHTDALGKADLDISGREEKYSTAGWVSTWKVGVTYDTPIDGIKLRALQSRDVRAPGLAELFAPVTVLAQTVVDDFAPNAGKTFTFQARSIGNVALQAEKSSNTEAGIVYQPDYIPGFSASIDYWRIAFKGGISALTAQNTVDLCFLGDQALCNNITRTGGIITNITLVPFNLSSTKSDGFDIESSYQIGLDSLASWIPGSLTFRGLATETSSLVTNPGVPGLPTVDTVGAQVSGNGNNPAQHWRVQGNQTYDAGTWGFNITERFTSVGKINAQYIQCTTGCPVPTVNNPTINNNVVPATMYVDIGGQYLLTETANTTAYFKVDNVSNSGPTQAPGVGGAASLNANGVVGELLGRMYHVGVRFEY